MISDKLYALAFEYKKTKLWNVLWRREVFAVKLSDGRIGYIYIENTSKEYHSLVLYIGEEGFDALRDILETRVYDLLQIEFQERLIQQKCLQCVFAGKDILSMEEREEVKQYARTHGVKISGQKAYPMFLKYEPNCYPWYLQTDKEQEDLCEALAAAVEVARLLKENVPKEQVAHRIDKETKDIPMLELQNGTYVLGKTDIPKKQPKRFPEPKANNDIGIAALKKVKKTGIWECEIIHFPEPIQNKPNEIPFFPALLLAVNTSTDYVLPVSPVEHYEDNPEELLNLFIEVLLKENICPMKMKVRNKRTYAFAKSFCERLKIAVSMEKELPVLDEVEADFWYRFGMGKEENAEEIQTLFASMVNECEEGQGMSHSEIAEHKQSYVISVSLAPGCYRHIQIDSDSTLLELHWAIIDAFEFDDDHAHVFFMNNISWSGWDCYYMEGVEDGERTTAGYKLSQVGLYKGKLFKYIFDFGEEWTFQCKVLRIVEGKTDEAKVIKRKGEAPPQYEWEDE